MSDQIKRTLAMIQQFSPVFEIRIPKANKYSGTYSGYYDNVNTAAQDVLKYNSKVPAIYITLNQIEPALLARANNRMDENAKLTTTDADVLRRVWLYIDIDPKRPAGISSTDEEHIAAIQKAYHIRDALLLFGWPEPVLCDSGNGTSLLYKIDMENSIQTHEIVNSALKAMDYFFSDEKIQIDQAVFNAARIVKLYGTKARKGDSTIDRPHRDSKILELPAEIQVLTLEMIQAFLIKIPEDETETLNDIVDSGSGFDIENWINKYDFSISHTKSWNGGTVYSLKECPFDSNHKAPDSSIIQHKSGAISFHCFHNSCKGHNWKELRDMKEPKRKNKTQSGTENENGTDNEDTHCVLDVSVLEAVATMRRVCDGARTVDGVGFNKFHLPIVDDLMRIEKKGIPELHRLYKILMKYRKQLEKMKLRVIDPRKNKAEDIDNHADTPISEITEALIFQDNYDMAVQMQKVQPIYFDPSKNYWMWKKIELYWKLIDRIDIPNSIIVRTGSYIIEKTTKVEIIESVGMTGRQRNVQEVKESWIYCKNGVYDVESKKIFIPTHDYFFTQPIPHNIGDSEDTPTIDQLFKDWMGVRAQILYEICAYCLYNGYPIHRMFWLFGGSGRNGKDQFLEFLQRLVGKENAIATDLEILLSSRFESSKLYKKKLAVISETNFNVIKNPGLLKGLTGHSYLRGEFKGKDGFDFYNTAKIIIATNGLPETTDKSKAFFARCITLEFKNRFAGKQFNRSVIDTIPEQEYENLIRKCFNKILPELLANGEFYMEGTEEEKEATYERISNPFLIFKERELIEDVNAETPVWVLRDLFNIFANKNNYRKCGEKEFTQTLFRENIETKRKNIGNHKWNFVLGLKPRAVVVYDGDKEEIIVEETSHPSSPDNQERGRDGRDGLGILTQVLCIEDRVETPRPSRPRSPEDLEDRPSMQGIAHKINDMLSDFYGNSPPSKEGIDWLIQDIKAKYDLPEESAKEYLTAAIKVRGW